MQTDKMEPSEGKSTPPVSLAVTSFETIMIDYRENDDIPLHLTPWQLQLVKRMAKRKKTNDE